MRWLFILLLLPTMVSAQGQSVIHRHKHYDTTKVEDVEKFKRRKLTTDVDSTGFVLYAWGDECFMKVNLRSKAIESFYEETIINGQPAVQYGNNKFQFKMYMTEYGAFEYDAILMAKPPGGISSITFPIETQGLTFHYQPELSQAEIDIGSIRPDSVVGSYAVYHSTRSMNVMRNGVYEEYATGKAFHIFTPRAWDATGDTVWGYIEIDTVLGTMTVGIDPAWLANADYPVTIDPTFGQTSAGASASTVAPDQVLGWLVETDSSFGLSENGTLDSANVRASRTGASTEYGNLAIYDNDGDPNNLVFGMSDSIAMDTEDWYPTTAVSGSVTAQDLWLCAAAWDDGSIYVYYDVVSAHTNFKRSSGSVWPGWNDPETTASRSDLDYKISIYFSYTASGGAYQGTVIRTVIQ